MSVDEIIMMTTDSPQPESLTAVYEAVETAGLPRQCLNVDTLIYWLTHGKSVAEVVTIVVGTRYYLSDQQNLSV